MNKLIRKQLKWKHGYCDYKRYKYPFGTNKRVKTILHKQIWKDYYEEYESILKQHSYGRVLR